MAVLLLHSSWLAAHSLLPFRHETQLCACARTTYGLTLAHSHLPPTTWTLPRTHCCNRLPHGCDTTFAFCCCPFREHQRCLPRHRGAGETAYAVVLCRRTTFGSKDDGSGFSGAEPTAPTAPRWHLLLLPVRLPHTRVLYSLHHTTTIYRFVTFAQHFAYYRYGRTLPFYFSRVHRTVNTPPMRCDAARRFQLLHPRCN